MDQPRAPLRAPSLMALLPNLHLGELPPHDAVYTLGRDPGCHIVVPGPLVSRLHAKIERQGPRYLISDAGSVNGTYVNGRRLAEPHLLADNDLISLGSRVPQLRFIDPDPTLPSTPALHFDEAALTFWLGDQALELTPTQFRLLLHLYRYAGEVCTRQSCAQAIWGRDYNPGMDAGALDQAITSLRNALRAEQPDVEFIQNRRGVGYLLVF